MGDIHAKYGYAVPAISLWERAFDSTQTSQDQLLMSLKIIKTSFVAQNSFYLEKYSERAQMQLN
jgi:hypothetical protein